MPPWPRKIGLGGKRLRFWRSSARPDEALREKIYAAERRIAVIRLSVIALNTFAYLLLFDWQRSIQWLALSVIALAWAYALPVALFEPYRRMAFLVGAVFTSLMDVVFISAWLVATGGFDSPFYLLWYASIASIAFRYDYSKTVVAIGLDAAAYVLLLGCMGQLGGHALDVVLRVAYIAVVGVIGADAAREAYRQVRLRLEMRNQVRLMEEAEAQLEYQTLHDSLTGLPNRLLLRDRLEKALAGSVRDGSMVALLLLDLDYFKEVNDTFGHDWGDRVLQGVAERLRSNVRDTDTVARLGGDEFAIVLTGLQRPGDGSVVARKLLAGLDLPFEVEGQSLAVQGSIGLALAPNDGQDTETLTRRADAAMYAAKRERGRFAAYAVQHEDVATERLQLTADLQRAIDNGELVMHYQPQVSASGEGRLKAEALARWNHPTMGLLEPERFLPLAERVGLVRELTAWSLDAALRQAQVWQDAGKSIDVALNLSPLAVHDDQLPELIKSGLERFGVMAGQLTLEVPEGTLMSHGGRAIEDFQRLRAVGVQLSVDAFGAGYSSLAYLKQLPVSELKIHRSFVLGLLDDAKNEALVKSIVELAHNLGLVAVAEGIETGEAWRRLKRMGCDRGQGYYLGVPMPAAELESWLTQQNVGSVAEGWRPKLQPASA